MSAFDDFLPWSVARVNSVSNQEWRVLFTEAKNVKQDQKTPITNLMILLHHKLFGHLALDSFKNRHAIVNWYQSIGRFSFAVSELERHINHGFNTDRVLEQEGINLVGYYASTTGLGEDIRNLSQMLDELNVPYCVVMLGHPADKPELLPIQDRRCSSPKYTHSVFCMNLIEFEKLWKASENLSREYGVIALQAPWELPLLPRIDSKCLETVSVFWCISDFVQEGFLSSSFKNSIVVPAICISQKGSEVCLPSREYSPFTFLYIFDASSYLSRKNPMACIRAFQLAFKQKENVRLILKVANIKFSDAYLELQNACLADERVHLDSTMYSKEELSELIRSCDCYVSLHRSEGFGRTIAEACLLKKPVIATNWSGSTDILGVHNELAINYSLEDVALGEYPFSEHQQWAKPDLDDASTKMQAVHNLTEQQRSEISEKNHTRAFNKFSVSGAKNIYAEIIDQFFTMNK